MYAKTQQDDDDETLFCHFKAYTNQIDNPFGSLYMPPTTFAHFVSQISTIFFDQFEEFVIQEKVVNKYVEEFQKIDFFHPCKNFPYNYLIRLIVRMRLY